MICKTTKQMHHLSNLDTAHSNTEQQNNSSKEHTCKVIVNRTQFGAAATGQNSPLILSIPPQSPPSLIHTPTQIKRPILPLWHTTTNPQHPGPIRLLFFVVIVIIIVGIITVIIGGREGNSTNFLGLFVATTW